jgi:hypothetical protein
MTTMPLRTCVVPVSFSGGETVHVMRGHLDRRAGTPYFDSKHAEIVVVLVAPKFKGHVDAAAWYREIARVYAKPNAPPVPWQGGPK